MKSVDYRNELKDHVITSMDFCPFLMPWLIGPTISPDRTPLKDFGMYWKILYGVVQLLWPKHKISAELMQLRVEINVVEYVFFSPACGCTVTRLWAVVVNRSGSGLLVRRLRGRATLLMPLASSLCGGCIMGNAAVWPQLPNKLGYTKKNFKVVVYCIFDKIKSSSWSISYHACSTFRAHYLCFLK